MAETLRIEIPIETVDRTDSGVSSAEKKLSRMGETAERAGKSVQEAGKKVSKFDESAEKTQRSLARWAKDKYEVFLEAKDRISPILQTLRSSLKNVSGRAWGVTMKAVDLATAPVKGVLNLLKNPILQAGAVLGISVGISDTINTYKDFEAAMSQVKAISGATGSELEKLTAKAKEMGATTKFTAAEAAEGFNYMAMAGWKTQDMLGGIEGILNLAAASGESLGTTSDIVTDALTAFGMKASDAGHFADVMAAASSNANTNVSLMGETFKYAGAMAGTLKYSIEDVALATGLMANSGIKGNMAGTALNSIFTRLSTNTNGATDAIKALGIEYFNADGTARKFGDVMKELRTATAHFTDEQKAQLGNTVAGTYAQKGFLAILNATAEDYDKLSAAVNNADGAAAGMAETMLDNLQGSITLLQSVADGVKLSFGERLAPYVRGLADWLTEQMPYIEAGLDELMNTVDGKVQELQSKFGEISGTDEWKDADLLGKVSIAWDEIIAQPFSEWWESEGKQMISSKAGDIGNAVGSGISSGLLALLGFDPDGAIEDGKSIGGSFIRGFREGFDTEQITEALKEWASNHKVTVTMIGIKLGSKLVGGVIRGINNVKSLFGNGGTTAGGGIGSSYTTSTMSVTAGVVNIMGSAGGAAASIGQAAAGSASVPGGGTLALPGTVASGTAAAGGLTSATGWLGRFLQIGSKGATIGADGTLVAVQGGVGGTLGGIGTVLGSSASTAAGAAAAGGASVLGILGGLLGIGSGIRDIFHGTQADGKEARDEYAKGGTKLGMVGAGAAAGAAIGSVIPVVGTGVGAAVGAGIGGVGALLGGNKAGLALSDAMDEGGWLDNAKQTVGGFFTESVPTWWDGVKESANSFFTDTLAPGWTEFWDGVGSFFTESVPAWWDGVKESATVFFTETLPEKWTEFWDGVGNFFTETVPYALGYASGKAELFFTEILPEKWTGFWDGVGSFFTESIPAWWEDVKESVTSFFTDTLVPGWLEFWDGVGSFFTESIPAWWENVKTAAGIFFLETLPTKWTEFWDGVGNFFTESIPAWWENITSGVATFFAETVVPAWNEFWGGVGEFFTESVPTWFENVTSKAAVFFTETIPGKWVEFWGGVESFFTESIPTWWEGMTDKVSEFFTVTIPDAWNGFWDGLWGDIKGFFGSMGKKITGSFKEGYSDATGHAAGGYVSGGPQLSWLAEEGYGEFIIPTNPSRRGRALELYEQAGAALGVSAHASGGYAGSSYPDSMAGMHTLSRDAFINAPLPYNDSLDGPDGPGLLQKDAPIATGENGNTGSVQIQVSVSMAPQFVIYGSDGQDGEGIIQVIRQHMKELADELGGEIAGKLRDSFSNMPVGGK